MSSLNVTVLGTGAWATTIAKMIAENNHNVTLWCHRRTYLTDIQTHQENRLSLPGIKLPRTLIPSLDIAQSLAQADYIVLGVPSTHLAPLLPLLKNHHQPLMSLVKGLIDGPNWQLSSHFKDHPNYTVLSGPNLANEIAHQKPAATVIASQTLETAITFQKIVTRPYFRIYTHTDVTGVELGGILKNIMALAAGICDGLALGNNAKSALLTRSLNEMIKIGKHQGAQPETLMGLSGLGDLMATCYSPKSRNWQVGYALGQGKSIQEIQLAQGTSEGIRTTPLIVDWAKKHHLDLPITSQIEAILTQKCTPQEAMETLMNRKEIQEVA